GPALVPGFSLHLGKTRGETPDVGDEPRRREADPLVRRVEPAGKRRLERPEVDAVQALAEPRPGEPAAEGPEPGAVGTKPQQSPREAAGAEPPEDRSGEGRGDAAASPRRGHAIGELVQDLPVVERTLGGGEERGRVLGGVPYRQDVERDVVVVVLEREGRG